jgi:hypothetical protein
VRVPGIGIDELREVALELGARGVGLYTHHRFVHIDFRNQRKYQWSDATDAAEETEGEADEGTQGDGVLASLELRGPSLPHTGSP